MNPVQHGLQANALLCVLPHLLKPDTLLPANVHSFSRALPYSVQAVEPRLKVKLDDQPTVVTRLSRK